LNYKTKWHLDLDVKEDIILKLNKEKLEKEKEAYMLINHLKE
jgi:hypothetical protein